MYYIPRFAWVVTVFCFFGWLVSPIYFLETLLVRSLLRFRPLCHPIVSFNLSYRSLLITIGAGYCLSKSSDPFCTQHHDSVRSSFARPCLVFDASWIYVASSLLQHTSPYDISFTPGPGRKLCSGLNIPHPTRLDTLHAAMHVIYHGLSCSSSPSSGSCNQ